MPKHDQDVQVTEIHNYRSRACFMLWKIDPLEILQTIETCKVAENAENEYAENA